MGESWINNPEYEIAQIQDKLTVSPTVLIFGHSAVHDSDLDKTYMYLQKYGKIVFGYIEVDCGDIFDDIDQMGHATRLFTIPHNYQPMMHQRIPVVHQLLDDYIHDGYFRFFKSPTGTIAEMGRVDLFYRSQYLTSSDKIYANFSYIGYYA